MVAFITRMIEEAAEISEEKGKAKYKAYFVNPKRRPYERYRADVDTNLMVDGYENVISNE